MPIVTLSTDIGQQDYIVGAIKGQLLQSNADLNLVDISHYLSQSNFPEAAYICGNAFKYFPDKTIHIVIINFFEKKSDNILVAEYNNQYIICADNGLLTMITDTNPVRVYKLPYKHSETFLQTTQHIASFIQQLINGKSLIETVEVFTDYLIKFPLKPMATGEWIKGQIIFIDNFENVVINITKPIFEEYRKGRAFSIVLKRNEEIESLSNNYLTVPEGEKLAWFNSAGYLELAVNKGNMAGLFGLQGFNELNYKEGKSMQNKLFYSNVTIFFH
ncbi:MAG: SAM-dependent chlorinase/fluorinase [Bacteroidetes bacterium]|nr:SAM-dependent chlorinase/fluorinase [Bacteroidota bacterium]